MKLLYRSDVGASQQGSVEVAENDTIGAVKEKIATIVIVDASETALAYDGSVLKEKKLVKNYGLKEGDKVELIPKNRKGA